MSAADASPTVAGVVVIIPALNEEVRISATVGSAQRLANVCHVIVADDGSTDDTA
ncbi:MAG: glycosyltransferase, partial [Frankiaceae bacterium]|nr:glycosyltransferase [Frankiaceae bacterium]